MRPWNTVPRAALVVAALALAPTLVLGQRAPSTRDANKGAPEQASFSTVALPTMKVVKERSNVAAMLAEKAKKLGLDAAATDSLRALAAAIDARNAGALASYDSLRTKARADQSAGTAGSLEGRARVAMAGTTIQSLGEQRKADADLALAVIPADKHAAAKELIADQDEEFGKLSGRRGGRRP